MAYCRGKTSGSKRLRGDLARKAAKQAASVVELMHSTGLVHGGSSDFCAYGNQQTLNIHTPKCIAVHGSSIVQHRLQACDRVRGCSDVEMYATLDRPETEQVVTCDHSPPGPSVPRELIAPVDNIYTSSPYLLQEDIIVIDFG